MNWIYGTNGKGKNYTQGFRGANGRKEAKFIIKGRMILIWILQVQDRKL
jgi:hypothetical protein